LEKSLGRCQQLDVIREEQQFSEWQAEQSNPGRYLRQVMQLRFTILVTQSCCQTALPINGL